MPKRLGNTLYMETMMTTATRKRDELLAAIDGKARGENLFVVPKPLGEDTIEVKLYRKADYAWIAKLAKSAGLAISDTPAWTKATRDYGVRIYIAPEWR
jgi:hypothetical protein